MCLEMTRGDPLEAQKIEEMIRNYPEPMQRALVVLSQGNARRLRQAIRELSARWWHRWLAWVEQKNGNDEQAV